MIDNNTTLLRSLLHSLSRHVELPLIITQIIKTATMTRSLTRLGMSPHLVKLFMSRLQMAVKPEHVSFVTATNQARIICSRSFTAVSQNTLDVLYEQSSHIKMINIRAPTHSHSKHMGVGTGMLDMQGKRLVCRSPSLQSRRAQPMRVISANMQLANGTHACNVT